MPAPSVTGTPPTHAFSASAANVSHSVTTTADTNALITAGYGYGLVSGTALFNSATFNGVTCNDIVGATRDTNRQFCRIFTLYDTDASWPGTGTFTAQVNSNDVDDIGIMSCCVKDVDTSSPITGSGSAVGASSSSPSVSGVSSSTNDTVFSIIASYSSGWTINSGDDTNIDNDQNSTSFVSGYLFSEPGGAGTITAEAPYTSAVEFAMATISLAGTVGGAAASLLAHRNNSQRILKLGDWYNA